MAVINPATGNEFHWAFHHWTPQTMARWDKKTIYGGEVKGSVRAIAHLDWMNRRSIAVFGVGIEVIQSAFNTGVKASAGTHDFDLVFDLYIPGVGWWRQQQFFRNHGFWCWYRHAPLFGNHIHGICMVPFTGDQSRAFKAHGFKVGEFIDGGWSTSGSKIATAQVDDYVNHAFGLYNQHQTGSDTSYFPSDIHLHFDFVSYVQRRTARQAAA